MELIATIIGSVLSGGALTAAIKYYLDKRKKENEADLAAVQGAAEVLKMYEKAIHDLQERVENLQQEVAELKEILQQRDSKIYQLKTQLGDDQQ